MLINTTPKPEALAKEAGINLPGKLKNRQVREKPVEIRSYVGGPKKLSFTMRCNDACLRNCRNRDTAKCGDACFKFSNFKEK